MLIRCLTALSSSMAAKLLVFARIPFGRRQVLDPYARAHAGMLTWDPAVFGYRMESGDDTTFDEHDSAFFMPQCVVVDPNFDWQGEPGNHAVPFQQLQQFARVDPRARHLLAENSAASVRAQLLKLRVERLAVGADAGIAEASFFRLYFRSYVTESVTH